MGACVFVRRRGENKCEQAKGVCGGRSIQNVILAITRGRLHYKSDGIYFSKRSGRGVGPHRGKKGVCAVSGQGGQEEEEEVAAAAARETSVMVEKRLSRASWSATALTSRRDQRRSEGEREENGKGRRWEGKPPLSSQLER